MDSAAKGYAVLPPSDARWSDSGLMRIPNVDLGEALRTRQLGARFWRLPPYSANTWHKHVEQEELYVVLEGTGRMRVGTETLTVARYGAVLVAPSALRQVFNDTAEEALWLIVGAPRHEGGTRLLEARDFYPEDPRQLPGELAGRKWPPERRGR